MERKARDRDRALDPADQRLLDEIHDALIAAGINASRFSIEVDRNRVVLRGKVRDMYSCSRTEEVVRSVDGVDFVVNQLVIEPE